MTTTGKWLGPIAPFHYEAAGDVETASGVEAVKASIAQILGTRCTITGVLGECPWRPSFGSTLSYLRHKSLPDPVLKDLARHAVIDSIRKWEPRAVVTGVEITIDQEPNSKARVIYVDVAFVLASEQTTRARGAVAQAFLRFAA